MLMFNTLMLPMRQYKKNIFTFYSLIKAITEQAQIKLKR
jgi:hypothetical protein